MLGNALKIAVLAALLVFPFAVHSPYYLHLLQVVMIYAVVTLGLDVVFGYTGEVSVGHAALFGIGSYTAGVFADSLGIGFGWALPAGILVSAGFGALLALPALRVTGPYLAMVTLAFGTIVQILINEMTFLTEGPLGISLTRPAMFDWRPYSDVLPFLKMPLKKMADVQYYYVVVLALVATLVVIGRLLASRYGRAFEALRDSPIACDCMGVSVYKHKVLAFVVSAGFAGLGGVLFAYSELYMAPNNFGFEQSITFLLAVTMGGRKSRLGPIMGAAIVVYLPNLLADIAQFRIAAGVVAVVAVVAGGIAVIRKPDQRGKLAVPVGLCVAFFAFSLLLNQITDYKLTVYGMMILFVVYYLPDGIFGFLRGILPTGRSTGAVRGDEDAAWTGTTAAARDSALLQVQQVVMQFGGLKALDRVDLSVKPGSVHGLIGPNGSGKSTMMNVLTGIYTPTAGAVQFLGRDVAGHKPAEIAGRGIARTFQNVQLFGELTLLENVMVGLQHTYRGTMADAALLSGRERREEAAARTRAAGLLRFVGLDGAAHEEARNLPYGKQRLLEIARALALDPLLLLLDEPAAGLTAPDIQDLMRIIRKIRDHGITMILIEHHMDVVMSVCDTISVLDFGQKIAEGTPAEVQRDEKVLSAYLGGSHDTVAA